MPSTDFLSPNLKSFLVVVLLITLFSESIGTWFQWWRARNAQRSFWDWCDQPRTDWSRFAEQTVVVLVLLWLGAHVAEKLMLTSPKRPDPLKTDTLLKILILSGTIAAMLPAILLASRRPAAEFGLSTISFRDQIRDGMKGFILSVLPMTATMVLTMPLRTRDTQNPLLRLLTDSGNPTDILLICILAVVVAPLSEEMMFRVVLQGWLTKVAGPAIAIPLVVVAFAAIHGLADGIALLPLATILGYVFHRRHSYVSVVVIHFLFNATMLALQVLTQSSAEITNP